MATTKTMLKAKKKAAIEKKAKELEERKAAVAACKLAAQAKKRAKIILLMEACTQKAAAKVVAIHAKLAGVMAQGVTTLSTKPPGSHVSKKVKGASGQVMLHSSLPMSSALPSPQHKGASPMKRTMLNSPLRLLTGLSSSSGSFSTMDSMEYFGKVPATRRAVIRGISQASPPAATGCGVRAIAKGGCHYVTPACSCSGFHRGDTDGESTLAISNNSLALSSLPRLPAQGAILDGGSISSASSSSFLEMFGEVPGRGTVRTTAHGPGADASSKDDSYKDSVEAMWGEWPPAHTHEDLGQCGRRSGGHGWSRGSSNGRRRIPSSLSGTSAVCDEGEK
jgi:hypothetical protein